MTTQTAHTELSMATRSDARTYGEPAPFPLVSAFDAAVLRVRSYAELARRRPHDALAFFILSCVGTYFTFVGYLAVLCGPAE